MALGFLLWFVSLIPCAENPAPAHPIYISLLEVSANKQGGVLECSMKIFSDDLEKAVRQWGDSKGPQPSATKEGIWNYVRAHLQCSSEGITAQIHPIGLEGDPDAQWIHFEVRFKQSTLPKQFELYWSSLFEVFPGQRNIVHVSRDSRIFTYILDSGKSRQIIPLTE